MTSLLLFAFLLGAPEVRQQGVVKAHVWAASAGIEGARVALRGVTALANDATAFDSATARALLRDAKGDVSLARSHAQKIPLASADASQNRQKLESDLGATQTLIGKLDRLVASGVSPKNDDTQADNTMLGGAAAHRDLPPGKGGDVTKASNRGQRGGTQGVKALRDDLKAAWDKLDNARDDLNKVAGDADTTIKLPEP
jgi:hypothetical protein